MTRPLLFPSVLTSGLFLAVTACLLAVEPDPGSELLPPLAKVSPELGPLSLKPKMAVMDTTVSFDGLPRPDLGSAFTDAITARLLKHTDYDILDAGGSTSATDLLVPPPVTAQNAKAPVTPGPSVALETGKAIGADFVVVPTIVGIQGDYRLTMRKLLVPTGKIEAIIQESFHADSLEAVFKAFEFLAQRLAPAKPERPAFTYIKAWMSPPPPQPKVDSLSAEIASAPKALRGTQINPAKLAAIEAAKRAWSGVSSDSREPQRTGRIEVVDRDWCFCEIACKPGEVQANDQVFAWTGQNLDTLVTMTVTRVEGSRAIAEFVHHHPNAASLRTGDGIFRWVAARKR